MKTAPDFSFAVKWSSSNLDEEVMFAIYEAAKVLQGGVSGGMNGRGFKERFLESFMSEEGWKCIIKMRR